MMQRLVLSVLFLAMLAGCAQKIPGPEGMVSVPSCGSTPLEIFRDFSGIPYRNDGAVNQDGQYTLFADRSMRFAEPGLNCSGFTVAASRFILGRNFSLDQVTLDRNGDSGPDAELGEDWDFGFDLIMNLSDGRERKVMLPFGKEADMSSPDGMSLRGFTLHDRAAWDDVLSKMKKDRLYLFSLSKPVNFKNYKMIHHHVGLMAKDGAGKVYLCHATRKGGVNMVEMTADDGIWSFLSVRPEDKLGDRMILIVETHAGIR